MLPFTTYNIPESDAHKMHDGKPWLCILTETELNAADEELLKKICMALKADFDSEVLLINLHENASFTVKQISEFDILLMISFGVVPSRTGLWIDINTPDVRIMEKMFFILTKPLHELATNPNAKKQLWSGMQLYLETQHT